MRINTLISMAAAVLVASSFPAGAESLDHELQASRAIDLTQRMHNDMVYWPGGVPFKKVVLVDYEQGYLLHKFEMGENTGTHVDAPAHFVQGNRSIDELSLSSSSCRRW